VFTRSPGATRLAYWFTLAASIAARCYVTDPARKRIVLGVTGGIAAYKAAELVRRLAERAVDVQVVMTEAACRFLAPATMQALSARPVFTDMWDPRVDDRMAHIELSRGRDAIVIAPATADFLAKLALGLADDLLSALCLARECPLVVAPAMNRQMWEHPATQRNMERLRADSVIVLGPASGSQACGEVGMGRMLEAGEIAESVLAALAPKTLSGARVLITAGPTFEAIDPVRGITNLSSGKMGYAVARASLEAGAEVTVVAGPTSASAPPGVALIEVISAAQMLEAVMARVNNTDIFIAVAAVADYRPARTREQKIKKSEQKLTIELEPTTDILATVAALPGRPFCVGFAAESEKLDEHAQAKRRSKKLPLIAANLAQRAIGSDENEIVLFDDQGRHALPRGSKEAVARGLVAHIAGLYRVERPGG
jgi:phosphopantothenoylcysteine decarboxylase / phosphopantothenate---cysteine ligase